MAITKDSAEFRRLITTTIGPVTAWVQDERTIYVRGGLNESGVHPEATEALQLGRDVEVSVRAHFKQRNGRWTCARPFIHRVDQGRDKDPTGAMVRRALDALADALTVMIDTDGELLHRAGLEVAESRALERTAVAVKLRQIADHLDAEAYELRRGGRWTYRRGVIGGGAVTFGQVETAAGELLDPVAAAPSISGALNYPLAYVKDNEETD